MSFSRHEGDLPKFPGVISAAELMAMGGRNRHASLERNPHWHYDAGVRVLWTKADGDRYEVDLERIPGVEEFVDWLRHLSYKTWGTAEVIGCLAFALFDVLGDDLKSPIWEPHHD